VEKETLASARRLRFGLALETRVGKEVDEQ